MKHRATEQQRNQDLTSETAFTRKVSLKKTFSRSFFFIFTLLLCCSVFQMLFYRINGVKHERVKSAKRGRGGAVRGSDMNVMFVAAVNFRSLCSCRDTTKKAGACNSTLRPYKHRQTLLYRHHGKVCWWSKGNGLTGLCR